MQLPKEGGPSNVLADTLESGTFQWLALLGVTLLVVAAIRFFWTLGS
jgi:hypothetical protein